MPDPAATKGSEDKVMETFRQVRDAIERKIVDFLNGFDRSIGLTQLKGERLVVRSDLSDRQKAQ